MMSVTVSTLTENDVETLVEWAAAEGWNPGLDDPGIFRRTDPDGFIGTYVDGRLAAGIAAVAYGNNYGFIGLYISRDDLRGRGYGRLAWAAGMHHLAGRTIGLDAVDAQLENYRSKGFQPAYRTIRFGGIPIACDPRAHVTVRPVTPEILPLLEIFDRDVFGSERAAFLESWIDQPHLACAAFSDDRPVGYATIRQCRDGFKIGPLFAADHDVAAALFHAVTRTARGPVYIDVPSYQTDFCALLTICGLKDVFQTTRMYHGSPRAPDRRVFGVTTLELG